MSIEKKSRHRLTRRHVQVLTFLAKGLTSEETAEKLGLNFKTVEAHRAGLLQRMEARNGPHAVYLGIKKG